MSCFWHFYRSNSSQSSEDIDTISKDEETTPSSSPEKKLKIDLEVATKDSQVPAGQFQLRPLLMNIYIVSNVHYILCMA